MSDQPKLEELARLILLRDAVKRILAQNVDQVCWRDTYTELADLVSVDWKPTLLPREAFIPNCERFCDSLLSGEHYVAKFTERLKWTMDEPTKPGWYWEECISLDVPCKPRIIEVRNDYRSGRLTGHATVGFYKWAGPIELPEES
jgi:hypothetical protein